jgi:hypothetical protein
MEMHFRYEYWVHIRSGHVVVVAIRDGNQNPSFLTRPLTPDIYSTTAPHNVNADWYPWSGKITDFKVASWRDLEAK